ncbi:putative oxidoreductase GLYR1 homolog [Photinus pyralis]|uniref:putative oxidoreductase GLYR1 homolog n=1 Tax=Photinus pyralis TaxID=7054 RepID=UPI00126735E9|nr:putative oxidoreductase GLYR1 homolog [Photinus pyralis]XP_031340475.1 putative oxidoreductase GLYR1 homolog [Photinus pyralis]
MSEKLQIGSLVWAKMKGFSPWPGLISKPKHWVKKPAKKTDFQCIYFFGTKNYAWIEESNIMPYLEFKEKLVNSCKSASFKEAVAEIEEFLERIEADPTFTPEQFDNEREQDTTFDRIKEDSKSAPKKKKESTGGTKRLSTAITPKASKKRKSSQSEENGAISPVLSNHVPKNYEELLNRPLVEKPVCTFFFLEYRKIVLFLYVGVN